MEEKSTKSKVGNFPKTSFWILFSLLFALDQVTKLWIERNFFPGQTRTVVEGVFNIVYVTNDGIAFGLFQGNNFLMGITVCIVSVVAIWQAKSFDWRLREVNLVGALLVAGALGNLTDRIRIHHVIDFLDFHLGPNHWPAFNVADSCITVSVIWIFFRLFFGSASKKAIAEK